MLSSEYFGLSPRDPSGDKVLRSARKHILNMGHPETTVGNRSFRVRTVTVAYPATLNSCPLVHTSTSAWLPCSPKDRVAFLYVAVNLLDVPSTVSLASYKGFDPTVRLSIKPLRLASFETPGSLRPGLKPFSTYNRDGLCFFIYSSINESLHLQLVYDTGLEPVTIVLRGQSSTPLS